MFFLDVYFMKVELTEKDKIEIIKSLREKSAKKPRGTYGKSSSSNTNESSTNSLVSNHTLTSATIPPTNSLTAPSTHLYNFNNEWHAPNNPTVSTNMFPNLLSSSSSSSQSDSFSTSSSDNTNNSSGVKNAPRRRKKLNLDQVTPVLGNSSMNSLKFNQHSSELDSTNDELNSKFKKPYTKKKDYFNSTEELPTGLTPSLTGVTLNSTSNLKNFTPNVHHNDQNSPNQNIPITPHNLNFNSSIFNSNLPYLNGQLNGLGRTGMTPGSDIMCDFDFMVGEPLESVSPNIFMSPILKNSTSLNKISSNNSINLLNQIQFGNNSNTTHDDNSKNSQHPSSNPIKNTSANGIESIDFGNSPISTSPSRALNDYLSPFPEFPMSPTLDIKFTTTPASLTRLLESSNSLETTPNSKLSLSSLDKFTGPFLFSNPPLKKRPSSITSPISENNENLMNKKFKMSKDLIHNTNINSILTSTPPKKRDLSKIEDENMEHVIKRSKLSTIDETENNEDPNMSSIDLLTSNSISTPQRPNTKLDKISDNSTTPFFESNKLNNLSSSSASSNSSCNLDETLVPAYNMTPSECDRTKIYSSSSSSLPNSNTHNVKLFDDDGPSSLDPSDLKKSIKNQKNLSSEIDTELSNVHMAGVLLSIKTPPRK